MVVVYSNFSCTVTCSVSGTEKSTYPANPKNQHW